MAEPQFSTHLDEARRPGAAPIWRGLRGSQNRVLSTGKRISLIPRLAESRHKRGFRRAAGATPYVRVEQSPF